MYTCSGIFLRPLFVVHVVFSVQSALRWCRSSTSFASGNWRTSRRNMSIVRCERHTCSAAELAMVLLGRCCTQVRFSTYTNAFFSIMSHTALRFSFSTHMNTKP